MQSHFVTEGCTNPSQKTFANLLQPLQINSLKSIGLAEFNEHSKFAQTQRSNFKEKIQNMINTARNGKFQVVSYKKNFIQGVQRKQTLDQKIQKNLSKSNYNQLISRNPTLKSNFIYNRKRLFQMKIPQRINIFEGMPFVQYEQYIRQDESIQWKITDSQLKLVVIKAYQLKDILYFKKQAVMVYQSLNSYQRIQYNESLEQIMSCMDYIAKFILQDFTELIKEQKLGTSPLEVYKKYIKQSLKSKNKERTAVQIEGQQQFKFKINVNSIDEENIIMEENRDLYFDMIQYLKSCIEIYFVIRTNPEFRTFNDKQCYDLYQKLSFTRFNLSTFKVQIQQYEKQFFASQITKKKEINQNQKVCNFLAKKFNNNKYKDEAVLLGDTKFNAMFLQKDEGIKNFKPQKKIEEIEIEQALTIGRDRGIEKAKL